MRASRSTKKGGNNARARESWVCAADNGVLGAVDLGIEQDANSLPSIENGRALLNRGLSLGFDAARELLLDEVGEDVVVKVDGAVEAWLRKDREDAQPLAQPQSC